MHTAPSDSFTVCVKDMKSRRRKMGLSQRAMPKLESHLTYVA